MKRKVLAWCGVLAVIAAVALAAPNKPKQFRIIPGDATDPQTFSFNTSMGNYAKSWTIASWSGAATFKFRGVGSNPDFWIYLPDGGTFSSAGGGPLADTLIVDRDAAASGATFTGYTE